MPGFQFSIDRVSFWLGFLAASLFWFLIYRFRRYWPDIKLFARTQLKKFHQQRLSGVEPLLLQKILQRAEAYHLASQLFPLNKIIIKPYLLAPPPQYSFQDGANIRKYLPQTISYLPDSPEFAAQYRSTRLSLVETLQNGVKIAIVGSPGSGKSTALAYLASLIASRDNGAGFLKAYFPLFIHIADIHLTIENISDPLEKVIEAVQFHAPISTISQAAQFIRHRVESNTAILILDGLDGLSPQEFEKAEVFLSALLEKYPSLRLVTAASPFEGRRLISLDIEPIAIAGWNRREIRHFIHSWIENWNAHFAAQDDVPSETKNIDSMLIAGWLAIDPKFHSPCEWTMKTWAACAGNLEGNGSFETINAHISRKLNNINLGSITKLASEMVKRQVSIIPYSAAEKLLSSENEKQTSIEQDLPDEKTPEDQKLTKPQPADAHRQILEKLISEGFIREHSRDRITFFSPWLVGYFASLVPDTHVLNNRTALHWPCLSTFVQFSLKNASHEWLKDFLTTGTIPLLGNLALATSWLRFAPQNNENKNLIMRTAVQEIQREDNPIATRLKLLANIATCNDPSLPILFKQWLSSNSSSLRQFAVLGLGINQDHKSVKEIASCLDDSVSEVQFAACYALSIMDSSDAKKELYEAMESGGETVKQVIAEALSQTTSGHEFLKEHTTSEDLLVRRAVVYGLSLIPEPWVRPILEKIAIEDSQWVVRNAAGQALDFMLSPNPYAPKISQKPYEAAWLIEFAAPLGQSVSRQDSPVPLLLEALQSNSIEDQISAAWMARKYPDNQIISEITKLVGHKDVDLRETAAYILWQIQPYTDQI